MSTVSSSSVRKKYEIEPIYNVEKLTKENTTTNGMGLDVGKNTDLGNCWIFVLFHVIHFVFHNI